MMKGPTKRPAALDRSHEDDDERGDEGQPPSDDVLVHPQGNEVLPPRGSEDSLDDGGGKKPAAIMQAGISGEPQSSPEGNVDGEPQMSLADNGKEHLRKTRTSTLVSPS